MVLLETQNNSHQKEKRKASNNLKIKMMKVLRAVMKNLLSKEKGKNILFLNSHLKKISYINC